MRIAYVAGNIDLADDSGATTHIREIVEGLRKRGHVVEMVYYRQGCAAQTEDVESGGARARWKGAVKALVPARVLHLRGNVRTWRHAEQALRSAEATLRASDIIYERDSFGAFRVARIRRRFGVPWVLECNAVFWDPHESRANQIAFPRLYKRLHVRKWKQADALITVTRAERERMIAAGAPADRTFVVPNSVNIEAHERVSDELRHDLSRRFRLGTRRWLGFLGYIHEWHKVGLLLEVTARLRNRGYDCGALVVGGGLWRQYRAEAESAGLGDAAVFTGPLPYAQVPAIVSLMDVCVLPGTNPYLCPVKLFDYAAARKPVVAADEPSVREFIENGKMGLLFAPGDAAAFEQQICRALNDGEYAAGLASGFHDFVARERTWDRAVEATEIVLGNCVVRHAG